MKCNNCGGEMKPGIIYGQHPFEIGVDGKTNLFVGFSSGTKEIKGIFGKSAIVDDWSNNQLECIICPNCGKVDFYINLGLKK